MLSLKNKIVAITGIGSPDTPKGNGRATAELCAAQGGLIEGLDILQEEGARTRKAIIDAGGNCHFSIGDVTKEADINRWIEGIIDRHGRLDILINNVGQSERILPESVDNTVWQQQIDLNLNSVMMTCRAALPHMIRKGAGAIVNISSIAGIRYLGKPQIAYSAAK
ncbi:MAG: SDR family NAD(P)-dependent oxidoreductase, partial [Candidatus Puniceispirillaceae bacterium]